MQIYSFLSSKGVKNEDYLKKMASNRKKKTNLSESSTN
jgi:hypothetical protein